MSATRSFDERVVARARQVAAGRSTALDRLIRTDPERLTRPGNTKSAIDKRNALWYGNTGRSQDPWMREELHEQPGVHRQVPAAQRHAGCDARPSAPKSRGSRRPPTQHPLSQGMFVAGRRRRISAIRRMCEHVRSHARRLNPLACAFLMSPDPNRLPRHYCARRAHIQYCRLYRSAFGHRRPPTGPSAPYVGDEDPVTMHSPTL